MQAASLRNTANREKQRVPHIVGRKSFKNVRHDNVRYVQYYIIIYYLYDNLIMKFLVQRNSITGEMPGMHQMWKITHMKSNGDWVNDKAKEVNVCNLYLAIIMNI